MTCISSLATESSLPYNNNNITSHTNRCYDKSYSVNKVQQIIKVIREIINSILNLSETEQIGRLTKKDKRKNS